MHGGREWDFVFDVDVEDGAPPRKLATNASENPYIAADRFIAAEGLPAYFREQIVQFILTNTGAAQPGAAGAWQDAPITGGGADPLTGSGYRPPGGGGAPPPPPPGPSLRHVPAAAYLCFDAPPPPEALGRKLREFEGALAADAATAPLALGALAAGPLDGLLARLPAAVAGGAAGLTAGDWAVADALSRWPPARLFPALDVLRCLALSSDGAARLAAGAGTPVPVSGAGGSTAAPGLGALLAAGAAPGAPEASLQTALRLACNCFRQPPLRAWLASARSGVLELFGGAYGSAAKGVRLGAATLLLDLAVLARAGGGGAGGDDAVQLLSAITELLSAVPRDDEEAAFRGLLAFGTLLAGGDAALRALARDLGAADMARAFAGSASQRLREVAADVAAVAAA